MKRLFEEITGDDISLLDDRQLTRLLKILLHQEAIFHGISQRACNVPLDITVPDGGEDGRIKWDGGPECTEFLAHRFTSFQVKTEKMGPAKLGTHFLKADRKTLKPKVAEVLDAKGSYIVFYGHRSQDREKSIRAMRDSLLELGRADAETADIDVFDSDRIATWANVYPATVLYVRERLRQSLPCDMQSWESWSRYKSTAGHYFLNETLEGHVQEIRERLSAPRGVVRIVGLSGLGKTRLAFEALRPPKDATQSQMQALSDMVLFCPNGEDPAVATAVHQLAEQGYQAVVVVDECEETLHQRLVQEVERADSNISLLTLDYTVPEQDCPEPGIVRLRPDDLQDVVTKMLAEVYRDRLRQGVISTLADLARGFPRMAVLFAEAHLGDNDHIGQITDPAFLDRLLWERHQPDPVTRKVLQACALFEQIGFSGQVLSQRVLVAESVAGVTNDDFHRVCVAQMRRDIIQRRGRYIHVTPTPLVHALAGYWWREVSPETRHSLIEKIWATDLRKAFLEQMKLLDYVREARAVAEELCGPAGLVGNATSLETTDGLDALSSLAEIVPGAAVAALKRTYGQWSESRWNEIEELYHSLFFVLQKLCWWEETFTDAARLLLRLSVLPGKHQAKEHFTQLFRIPLSGTQAPPSARIILIEDCLNSSAIIENEIAVEALGKAITYGMVSRSGGMESQGSRKQQQDWTANTPAKWQMLMEYETRCLDSLADLAVNSEALGALAAKRLGEEFRGLLHLGMVDPVEKALSAVAAAKKGCWPEAEQALRHMRTYSKDLPLRPQEKVADWLKLMDPTDLPSRLKSTVTARVFEHTRNANGEFIDLAKQRTLLLAEELAAQGTAWYAHLPELFRGEQTRGYEFGRRLGELTENPEPFVESATEILQREDGKANPEVLAGFLGVDRLKSVRKDFLKRTTTTPSLTPYLRRMLRDLVCDREDLETVLGLIRAGVLKLPCLEVFSYSHIFDDPAVLEWFVGELVALGQEGARRGLQIVHNCCYGSTDKLKRHTTLIRRLILQKVLSKDENEVCDTTRTPDLVNTWTDCVEWIVNDNPTDQDFLDQVTGEIIEAAPDAHIGENQGLRGILIKLLSINPERVWAILGNVLLEGGSAAGNVASLISSHFLMDDEVAVISTVPDDVLLSWFDEHGERAVEVTSQIVRLIANDQETPEWSPIARQILQRYGSKRNILNALSSNLFYYAWSRNGLKPLKDSLKLLESLLQDPVPEVRQWARELLEHWRQRMADAEVREEERDI
ncbi:MAG TPA: hypothetical protein VMZ06_17920 [Candidatus Bathyarchaeia archaeon]|nr:hypothetical protein [Candidatus Bathyarchaeia archaeon]